MITTKVSLFVATSLAQVPSTSTRISLKTKAIKIIVKGTAEGNHKIGVTNQGANVANGKVILVETNGGNAAFSLTNPNNRVDLGAYQYFLTKEGNNWVLVHSQKALDSTSSVETNVPDNTGSNNAASNNPNVQIYIDP